MSVLADRYALEQLYCPSCGALFETSVVETELQSATGQRQ
jgi:hypothetical protein